ncbi:MAG: hypothetical protein HY301_12850 [Verrucomicrobia bacterium]|nr:hypothetical protein [Verrucomicrobiota bacterium]
MHGELSALVEHLRAHPFDVEARENLARLYAERLDRADLAVQEVEKLVGAPNLSPREITRRLNLKADFQLKYAADLDGARATLQRIAEQFPGSAWATGAEQRIASLKNELRGKKESQTLRLGSYEDDLGLR